MDDKTTFVKEFLAFTKNNLLVPYNKKFTNVFDFVNCKVNISYAQDNFEEFYVDNGSELKAVLKKNEYLKKRQELIAIESNSTNELNNINLRKDYGIQITVDPNITISPMVSNVGSFNLKSKVLSMNNYGANLKNMKSQFKIKKTVIIDKLEKANEQLQDFQKGKTDVEISDILNGITVIMNSNNSFKIKKDIASFVNKKKDQKDTLCKLDPSNVSVFTEKSISNSSSKNYSNSLLPKKSIEPLNLKINLNLNEDNNKLNQMESRLNDQMHNIKEEDLSSRSELDYYSEKQNSKRNSLKTAYEEKKEETESSDSFEQEIKMSRIELDKDVSCPNSNSDVDQSLTKDLNNQTLINNEISQYQPDKEINQFISEKLGEEIKKNKPNESNHILNKYIRNVQIQQEVIPKEVIMHKKTTPLKIKNKDKENMNSVPTVNNFKANIVFNKKEKQSDPSPIPLPIKKNKQLNNIIRDMKEVDSFKNERRDLLKSYMNNKKKDTNLKKSMLKEIEKNKSYNTKRIDSLGKAFQKDSSRQNKFTVKNKFNKTFGFFYKRSLKNDLKTQTNQSNRLNNKKHEKLNTLKSRKETIRSIYSQKVKTCDYSKNSFTIRRNSKKHRVNTSMDPRNESYRFYESNNKTFSYKEPKKKEGSRDTVKKPKLSPFNLKYSNLYLKKMFNVKIKPKQRSFLNSSNLNTNNYKLVKLK